MMQTIPSITTVVNKWCFVSSKVKNLKLHPYPSPLTISQKSELCHASQVADFFPSISPEIMVREARIEDLWAVAETHCTCFFPRYSFPLDFALRFNRFIGMILGSSTPNGRTRLCLVAPSLGIDGYETGGSEGSHVAGILTVDTVADFLPRKGPLKLRRTGIAYISNVAVVEKFRRKGIAKRLVAKAEAKARTWGCRAIALHCDLKDPAAMRLYTGQGFRRIKVPTGANWPHPRASTDVEYCFMMKLLHSTSTSTHKSPENPSSTECVQNEV